MIQSQPNADRDGSCSTSGFAANEVGTSRRDERFIQSKVRGLMEKREELRRIDRQLFELISQYRMELEALNGASSRLSAQWTDQADQERAIDLRLKQQAKSVNPKKLRLLASRQRSGSPASGEQASFTSDSLELKKLKLSNDFEERPQVTSINLSAGSSERLKQSEQPDLLANNSLLLANYQRANILNLNLDPANWQYQQHQMVGTSNGCSPMLTPSLQDSSQQTNPFLLSFSRQQLNQAYLTASQQAFSPLYTQPLQQAALVSEHSQAEPSRRQQQETNARPAGNNLLPLITAEIVQKSSAFKCHVCHSGFEDRHRLQQHLSIHLNLNPNWFEEKTIKETMAQYELKRGDYLCKLCKVRFETTSEFDKHMQLHGEKPHYCELCSHDLHKLISFRYYRQLLTHLRSHCFLYSCKFSKDCKQTANRKDYLKLHILKHHLNNKLPEQFTLCCY